VHLHPKSRGYVKLRSVNPLEQPIVQSNFLESMEDLDTMIEGLKLSRKVFQSEAFDKIREYEEIDRDIPHPPESDQYLAEYIRRYTLHIFHPVGTCRMGRVDDPKVVVDSNLVVKGLTNLRVADCSIMPEIVSGNTNAPAIMIGEKASQIIIQHWASQTPIKQQSRL